MLIYHLRRFAFAPLAALALGAALLGAPQGVSADQRDFRLVNDSDHAILTLYVSPVWSDRWGTDQLGDDIILPGSAFTLRFSEGQFPGTCEFDLRLGTVTGPVEERGVNLCRIRTLTYR